MHSWDTVYVGFVGVLNLLFLYNLVTCENLGLLLGV